MDCSVPGFSVHGISQARILQRVAISSSRGSSQPGIESTSPTLAGRFLTSEPHGKPLDPKDCYKSRCGWDIKEVGLLCFSVTHVHNAHARMHTHTDLVPHWVVSFIYPFECPTNRSDSTCLEITKASFSDCHFLLPLSISSSQKFEISFDLFLLLTSCSINLQLLSILPPKCLCLLFSPHSLYISFGTG